MMRSNVRRWPRYPFVAIVFAIDPSSDTGTTAKTADISLGGCYIDSANPLPPKTAITIELVHKGESFHALGEVVYSQPNLGMGIRFMQINPGNRELLTRWIEELETEQSPA